MLCVKRRKNEVVQIGEDISVRVVAISGNIVELGIEAPLYISILRDNAKCREVKRRMAAREPLHKIQDDFDHRDQTQHPPVDLGYGN
jgi:carbon storage regulator CsrA